MHDCCEDSAALYNQIGIFLKNVFDTQIAYELIYNISNISLKEMLSKTVNFTHENKDYVSNLMH